MCFRAKFDDQDIFDALEEVEGGSGSYDPVAVWEVELLNELAPMTMGEYAQLSVEERAIRICGMKLRQDWMSILQLDKDKKDR